MSALVALPVLLGLAVADAGEAPRLIVLEPKAVKVDAADARALQQKLVAELGRAEGLTVLGSSDLQQLADLSAQQLSAGCDGDACLAEIAQAMGAGLVVYSEVGRLGGDVFWQLGLWDETTGRILARTTLEDSSLPGLGRRVDEAALALLSPLAERGIAYAPPAASPLLPIGAVTASVGGLALVGGAVGLVVGGVVVGDASYDTGLRRGFQAAGPALVVTTVAGGVVGLVGGGLLVAAAVLGE